MRVWFNHWFSTAYHLINLMRDGEDLFVIGSSANPDMVYKQACDEWYAEDGSIAAEEYPEFCLEFCREHGVDVFVPRRFLSEVAKRRSDFERLGVRLFADGNSGLIGLLEDKAATYRFFAERDFGCVPPVAIASSLDEFTAGYELLKSTADRVCYKLITDDGARSFRVIDDSIEAVSGVLSKPGTKLTFEAAKKVLGGYDFSVPVLMMPYLEGTEISADCLRTASGNLIIPRFKMNGRFSEIRLDKDIMDECNKIMNALRIEMPLNIQFKMSGGKPYLLEINPRMSGGLQLSCAATGINIPKIALNRLLGKPEILWSYPDFQSRKVAHIETPICLD